MSIQPVSGGSTAYVPPAQNPAAQTSVTQSAGMARQVDAPSSVRDSKEVGASADARKAQPTADQLNQAVKQIQDTIKQTANSLQFSIDKDSGMTIVKVVDTESKKVIRQIPSEEVMVIAKALDKLQGLLVKQQA
ncbi:flagellar protein FlaG [Zoogloea sp.]|uniref:flagellar protein FlaG n=1 Tax=Zoogloea sp. TaxID=49181 RepID=UPI0035AEEC74